MIGKRSLVIALSVLAAAACSSKGDPVRPDSPYVMSGPLVSSRTTMVTAWYFPKNPLTDPALDDSRLSEDIRWGFRIFTNTPQEAPRFTPGKVTCNNCHLNGGQRERSLPLVGIAGMFPEYNRRSGRLYTLADRVVDCFLRSQNATSAKEKEPPTTTSKEVLALSAYITWLASGYEVGRNPAWRGQNIIAPANLIPIEKLDPQKGETLFKEHCTNCHGEDGRRQEGGPVMGARLLERRRRRGARLHAGGHYSILDALPESGQSDG